MRYIGAGGSPKVGDPATLKADHFTLSLIYKEPGRYAACHSHEIEESFLIIDGALIVGWEKDGEVVEGSIPPVSTPPGSSTPWSTTPTTATTSPICIPSS